MAQVAVIGVPNDTWGEAVKAVIVPRPGENVDVDEIVAMVKKAKGSVQAPSRWKSLMPFPSPPSANLTRKLFVSSTGTSLTAG